MKYVSFVALGQLKTIFVRSWTEIVNPSIPNELCADNVISWRHKKKHKAAPAWACLGLFLECLEKVGRFFWSLSSGQRYAKSKL